MTRPTSRRVRGMLAVALLFGLVGLTRPAVAQSLPKLAIQRFAGGVKAFWARNGVGAQFSSLTGIGSGKGVLGWRTVFAGPRAQLHDVLHGSGSYLGNQIALQNQQRQQEQLLEQMREAQARARARARPGSSMDARHGNSRYEPPHVGSQATWREPKFQAMRTGQRGRLVRAPVSPSSHPPPL